MSSVVVGAAAASEQVAPSMDPLAVRSEAGALLASCLQTHAAALSLREMDVFEDLVVVRCAECRRHYAVTVAAFETHQK